MPPSLLVGSSMTMLTSTRINQDEATGITYMDMVTASMGLVALETSCMMDDPNMPALEGVTRARVLSSQMSPIHDRQMMALNKNVYSVLA